MRKVLSLVLVLALVLGSFAFTFAATPSDVVGEDSEDAVNVLMELGVVSGYPDGSYKPAGIVTRGEMAKIIICALGLEDYAAGSSSFSDMAGHWADKYVAYAVSLGIINGYPDNTFKADNTVSYDEAAKMLVAALGYTEESLVGAWPVNWVTKAKVLGILDGIKAGSAGANRGDIAIMAYQTLDQAIGMTNKDGEFVATNLGTVAAAIADTMLDRLGSSLYDADLSAAIYKPGDAFVLTAAMADDAVANVRDYIGAYVTAYANSDDEILAIKEVKSTFLTGKFDTAGVGVAGAGTGSGEVPTVGGTFTNAADDKEYDLRAVATVAPIATLYFLNGKASTAPLTMGTFAAGTDSEDYTYKIAVDISGSKIDAVYSVSEWALSNDFAFEDGDLDDDNIAGNNFTLDDDDNIDLSSFELVGVDSLEDIEEDDIVYVYSSGGFITKIEVGTKTVTGTVEKIKSGDYYIDGVAYAFSDEAGAARPSIDHEIEATLNYAGDIYSYEKLSGDSDLYGIVLRTGVASEDVTAIGASDAEIELFLADGTEKTFTVDYDEIGTAGVPVGATYGVPMAPSPGVPAATDVYDKDFDDAATTATTDAWLLLPGDVVKYDLNTDGEIEAIEKMFSGATPNATVAIGTGAVKNNAAGDMTDKGYYQYYNVASDALIMTYDAAAAVAFTTSEDDYDVATRASLLDSTIPANAFYVVESGEIVFMYISNTATSASSVYAVLQDAEVNGSDAGFGVDLLIDGVAVFKDSDVNATGYGVAKYNKLFVVEYNTDGTVSALNEQALDPTTALTDIYNSANVAAAGNCALSGDIVSLSAGNFAVIDSAGTGSARATITLNSDLVVYKWNATDGVYDIANKSDIKSNNQVSFFDTIDDGAMIFDIVLIHTGAAY